MKFTSKITLFVLLLALAAPAALAKKSRLVAVSADVVEISGTMSSAKGFEWNQIFDFQEADIPGILSLGEFERQTAVITRLRLSETEGRAQVLSNPKIVTSSGNSAKITVGGKVPIPVINNQGVGSQLEEYGILLNVLPTIIPERGNIIDLQVQLSVSSVDYSRTVSIGTSTAPSFTNRDVETHVELNSGETLVIGGLKSSNRNVSETRVPILGHIPLIGLLFKYKDVPPQEIMPKEHFKIEVSRRLSKLMGYNFFAVIIALIGVLGMLYTAVPNGYIVMGVVCCVAVILTVVKQVVSKKYYYRSVCSKAAEIAFVAFWVISFSIVPIYNTQTCDWGLGVMMSYAFVMLCAYYIFERPLFIKKISEVNRQIKK